MRRHRWGEKEGRLVNIWELINFSKLGWNIISITIYFPKNQVKWPITGVSQNGFCCRTLAYTTWKSFWPILYSVCCVFWKPRIHLQVDPNRKSGLILKWVQIIKKLFHLSALKFFCCLPPLPPSAVYPHFSRATKCNKTT